MSTEEITFSQTVTFGNHLYRTKGEIARIIMENPKLGIRKTIVDNQGRIKGFPGIEHPDVVFSYAGGYMENQIRFRSSITLLDGQYALIWQIQPDGRYWEDDDGFGMTTDDEVDLYARFDEKGKFTEPFRVYSVGSHMFYGTDKEEQLAQQLSMKDDPLKSLQNQAVEMLKVMQEKICVPKEAKLVYSVPGTIYQVDMELTRDSNEWYVSMGIKRANSGVTQIRSLEFLPLEEMRAYLQTEKAREAAIEAYTYLYHSIESEI